MSLKRPPSSREWALERPGMMSQKKLKELIAKSEAVSARIASSQSAAAPSVKKSSPSFRSRLSTAGELHNCQIDTREMRPRSAVQCSE